MSDRLEEAIFVITPILLYRSLRFKQAKHTIILIKQSLQGYIHPNAHLDAKRASTMLVDDGKPCRFQRKFTEESQKQEEFSQ
jgi:hypothetical protein